MSLETVRFILIRQCSLLSVFLLLPKAYLFFGKSVVIFSSIKVSASKKDFREYVIPFPINPFMKWKRWGDPFCSWIQYIPFIIRASFSPEKFLFWVFFIILTKITFSLNFFSSTFQSEKIQTDLIFSWKTLMKIFVTWRFLNEYLLSLSLYFINPIKIETDSFISHRI